MCPGNLPKFAEAGAGVGGLAVSVYELKKFQGHDCCHIFSDSLCIKGIVQKEDSSKIGQLTNSNFEVFLLSEEPLRIS